MISTFEDHNLQLKTQCQVANSKWQGDVVSRSDFFWDMSISELNSAFLQIYDTGKKLPKPVYYSQEEDSFKLPLKSWSPDIELGAISVSEQFINAITSHIEQSLDSQLAEYLIYADMGHNHILINEDFAESELSALDSDTPEYYAKMISSPTTKFLYHTAEQIDLNVKGLKDTQLKKHLEHRVSNRNFIGGMNKEDRLEVVNTNSFSQNTVSPSNIEGFHKGPNLYLSANKNGCLAYTHKGHQVRFDISTFAPIVE